MEVELVFGSTGNLVKGGNGSIFHEVLLIYKMAALLFYHKPSTLWQVYDF
jgi:hypothetical protein